MSKLIYTARKNWKIPRPGAKIYTRSHILYNKDAYYLSICQIDWSDVINSTNVNEAIEKCISLFTPVIDRHARFKHINCYEKGAEWITDELLAMIDTRQYHEDGSNQHPTEENFQLKKESARAVSQMK